MGTWTQWQQEAFWTFIREFPPTVQMLRDYRTVAGGVRLIWRFDNGLGITARPRKPGVLLTVSTIKWASKDDPLDEWNFTGMAGESAKRMSAYELLERLRNVQRRRC